MTAASSKLDDGADVKESSIYDANPELSHNNFYEPEKDENKTAKAQHGDKLSSSLVYESVAANNEIGVKTEFEFSNNAAYGCRNDYTSNYIT